jgi:NitT/TauT family transport system substrate-binding protein
MHRHRTTLLALLMIAGYTALPASGAVESTGQSELPALQPLTIGLMPAVDSIPLIVAEVEGFFSDEGIDVTLEVFRDQLYREAALQANTVDATVSDLVNAIRSWANGADYRVLSSTQGGFSVVTSPDSAIRSLREWPVAPETVRTGLLEDSIINYTARRMLSAGGADPSRIEIVPTLQIPVRMEMLVAGELEAAVLPEPVTRMAVAAGANEIVSSDVLDWTPGVLLATGTALREKPAELEALLRAYDRAVVAVNDTPDSYRDVVVARAALPPPTAATMRIPRYRPAAVPTDEQVADVARWMHDRGLIAELPSHEEIVRQRPFD